MKNRILIINCLCICCSALFAKNNVNVVPYNSNGLCLTDTGKIYIKQYEMTIDLYFDSTIVSSKYNFYNPNEKQVVHIGIPHLHRYYFDFSKDQFTASKEKMFTLYENNKKISPYRIAYSVEYNKLLEYESISSAVSEYSWNWYYDKLDSIYLLNGLKPNNHAPSDFKPVDKDLSLNSSLVSSTTNDVMDNSEIGNTRNPILPMSSINPSTASSINKREIDSLNTLRLELLKTTTKKSIDISNAFFVSDYPVFVVLEAFEKNESKCFEIDYPVWNLRYQDSDWKYFKFPFQSFSGFKINDETSFSFTINLHDVNIESELSILRESITSDSSVIHFVLQASDISQYENLFVKILKK